MIRIWSFDISGDLFAFQQFFRFKKVEMSSWFAMFVDCGYSVENLVTCYLNILCNASIVTFVFYDGNPRERWLVYIWADNVTFTFPRCRYQIYNSCNVACLCYSFALRCATLYVTLRYVDEVMDLLSILTRMLDGQSFEISPNKWHSLWTPPVCRSTRPNDLTNKQQNYQIQHGTANSRGVPYSY